MIQDSWRPILGALVKKPAEMGLQDVAAAVGLSPSTTIRHLQAMVRLGLVRKRGRRKGATYEVAPSLVTLWIGPVSFERARVRPQMLMLEWSAHGKHDWRFPLLSRVPDEAARATLQRFLELVWERGLLTPWLLVSDEGEQETDAGADARREALALLRKPTHHEGLTFVVYGSSARGTARSDSDVDVLVITPARLPENEPRFDYDAPLRDLVSVVNLGAVRPIDLKSVARDAFFDDLPKGLQQAVVAEGITVLSTFKPHEFVEAMRGRVSGG